MSDADKSFKTRSNKTGQTFSSKVFSFLTGRATIDPGDPRLRRAIGPGQTAHEAIRKYQLQQQQRTNPDASYTITDLAKALRQQKQQGSQPSKGSKLRSRATSEESNEDIEWLAQPYRQASAVSGITEFSDEISLPDDALNLKDIERGEKLAKEKFEAERVKLAEQPVQEDNQSEEKGAIEQSEQSVGITKISKSQSGDELSVNSRSLHQSAPANKLKSEINAVDKFKGPVDTETEEKTRTKSNQTLDKISENLVDNALSTTNLDMQDRIKSTLVRKKKPEKKISLASEATEDDDDAAFNDLIYDLTGKERTSDASKLAHPTLMEGFFGTMIDDKSD